MAIDFTSDIGKVRLLIADLDEAEPVVSDDIIGGYLELNDGSVMLAAADTLDAIATSEVMLGKKIRTQDLSTDGPAVAAELRAQGEKLRARAVEESGAGSFFDVIPFGLTGHCEGEEYRW
ncbi:hypothetical protein [Paenarthrobacter ureafaciens]|uniref:hypothetical protein n=1 Tax=Paenarthrobacter ureafaciens TaxID=37931 RepID=UPI0009ADE5F1|nr:hypothetical protein [Paenarthrobacter ureafaciens]GLU58580.1 hypothetical protein Pure01_10930 [Paenarthrobacter ureafaciens]GLU61825.1 hypothetical protein Pure02_00750 [Paenarthrobacter ureafaciens]GLU66099.1 hypothetical protein Pure03_00750 [Paenarthrobacter ureafaciens]GLU71577.1 hypothetical protein Pure04_12920 [Paenarthrobacter ureafaciens]GLU74636.1 hypothetical protein Pure05_00760 [Paenarthrobacter ureafaciens]